MKYGTICKDCTKKYRAEYRKKNLEKIKLSDKKYYHKNKQKRLEASKKFVIDNQEHIKKYKQKYRENNIEHIKDRDKKYYIKNKEKINEYYKNYVKNRESVDFEFKLKNRVSSSIYLHLKKLSIDKDNNSTFNYLPYNVKELKEHLESQFEPWMTWENWGVYKISEWDDQDSSTWKWHIDHIIPHSKFSYKSMEDESFKECWALSNLRPYSAKQNIIDNDRK